MLNGHLSDEQIQELALGSKASHLTAHVDSCEACKGKLKNYQLLIQAVEQETAPAFDFDLAAMVVAQIETAPPKSITKGLWWLFGITIVAILTGAAIYFGSYLPGIADELKSLSIYLIAISGLVLITMLVIDQYKTYHQKMKLLDTP